MQQVLHFSSWRRVMFMNWGKLSTPIVRVLVIIYKKNAEISLTYRVCPLKAVLVFPISVDLCWIQEHILHCDGILQMLFEIGETSRLLAGTSGRLVTLIHRFNSPQHPYFSFIFFIYCNAAGRPFVYSRPHEIGKTFIEQSWMWVTHPDGWRS